MSRGIAGCVISLALLGGGCQHAGQRRTQEAEPGAVPDSSQWHPGKRYAFERALGLARDKMYQQLVELRVGQNTKMEHLVREVMVTRAELRDLAATAGLERVTWLPDGRCRVEIRLPLSKVVQALDRWDRLGRWAPHSQVVELNRGPMVTAAGEMPIPRER